MERESSASRRRRRHGGTTAAGDGKNSVSNLPVFVERAALAADMDLFKRIPAKLWPQVTQVAEQTYLASFTMAEEEASVSSSSRTALGGHSEETGGNRIGVMAPLPPSLGLMQSPPPMKANLVLSNYFSIIADRSAISQYQATQLVQDYILKMTAECNNGYGIVPITRATHLRASDSISESDKENHQRLPSFGAASRNQQQRMPTTPWKLPNLEAPPGLTQSRGPYLVGGTPSVIFQAEFKNRRQGLFMSSDRTQSGESLSRLIGKHVIMTVDEGIDLAYLRTFELLPKVFEGTQPEMQSKAPFTHILRQATEPEIQSLYFKAQEEHVIFVQSVLFRKSLNKNMMRITGAEFQFDRTKLIIFADMLQWANFNDLVHFIRSECERRFWYFPRIFIQRRFVLKFRPPHPQPMIFLDQDDSKSSSAMGDRKSFFVPPGKDFQSYAIALGQNRQMQQQQQQQPRGPRESFQRESWRAASSLSGPSAKMDRSFSQELESQGDHMSAPDGGPYPAQPMAASLNQ